MKGNSKHGEIIKAEFDIFAPRKHTQGVNGGLAQRMRTPVNDIQTKTRLTERKTISF